MATQKKKPVKKTAAKKQAVKKAPVKKTPKAKAEPRVPRTAKQLENAKVARAALLPEAIKVGRTLLKSFVALSVIADTLRTKQKGHPLAADMDDSDWRNLALRVIRQFERQDNVLEMRGRKAPPSTSKITYTSQDSAAEYRIKAGSKPVTEPMGRRTKAGGGAKKKVAKKATAKQTAKAKAKKAAPAKRGK